MSSLYRRSLYPKYQYLHNKKKKFRCHHVQHRTRRRQPGGVELAYHRVART